MVGGGVGWTGRTATAGTFFLTCTGLVLLLPLDLLSLSLEYVVLVLAGPL